MHLPTNLPTEVLRQLIEGGEMSDPLPSIQLSSSRRPSSGSGWTPGPPGLSPTPTTSTPRRSGAGRSAPRTGGSWNQPVNNGGGGET